MSKTTRAHSDLPKSIKPVQPVQGDDVSPRGKLGDGGSLIGSIDSTGDSKARMEQLMAKRKEERRGGTMRTPTLSSSAKSILQTEDSGIFTVNLTEKQIQQEKTRINVIRELIDTEKDYVKELTLIIEVFYKPLVKDEILCKNDINALFGNITVIHNVNQDILAKLEQRLQVAQPIQPSSTSPPPSPSPIPSPTILKIGDLLMEMVFFLRLYTAYVGNHEESIKTYYRCYEENKAFHDFCQAALWKEEVHFAILPSFLIMPIQRLCRYPLLVREILKHTPELHIDYDNISEGLKKLEEVTDFVNQKKRIFEQQNKVMEICQKVKGVQPGDILVPGRTFISEGLFDTRVREKNKQLCKYEKPTPRHFFLFNDVLIYTTPSKKDVFRFKEKIGLDQIFACKAAHDEYDKDSDRGFLLSWLDNRKTYIVYAKTEKERDEWVKVLKNQSLANLRSKSSKAFDLSPSLVRSTVSNSPHESSLVSPR